jgi:hypothetical protein
MRTAVTIALAIQASLASCSSDSVGPPPPAPIDWRAFDRRRPVPAMPAAPTSKEREVAEAYARAIGSTELRDLGPLLDEAAQSSFPGMRDAHGRDAVVAMHDQLFGALRDRQIALVRVWRTDSSQVLEWVGRGVHPGGSVDPGGGTSLTNVPVTFRGVTILLTRDDGSIHDIHICFDTATVQAQLGAGPKPLRSLSPPPWPTGAVQIFEQNGGPEETRNVAVVRASLDAIDALDEASYVGSFADDAQVSTLESAQPARGKDGQLAYFKALHRQIAELDTRISDIWGVASFVAVEYAINGEQIEPLGWVTLVRDRVVRLHVIDIVEVHDGRIEHIWRYDNLAEADAPGP